MAQINLKHSLHGYMIASSHLEAEDARKDGWKDYEPSESEQSKVPSFLGDSTIPDKFPGRQALIEAGITWATLISKSQDELTSVPGIGEATAKAILEKLNS